VKVIPELEAAGVNVKVIAAISEDLFDRQPAAYRHSVLPPEAVDDLMFVMSGTRRMWPLRNVGPLCDDYSLTADAENRWLTGGSEADVIAEAHLDKPSILAAVQRFASERPQRLQQQRARLEALG
jgi:transketolase